MKSYSQFGQDTFVLEHVTQPGTFLDIGSGDPFCSSNSFALERLGWRGLAIEHNSECVTSFQGSRSTPVILAEATSVDWQTTLGQFGLGPVIDYLSLDIDGREPIVLRNLIAAGFSFHVITCEHDRAWRGDITRNEIRDILLAQGYTLERADVKWNGIDEIEDWWVKK